MRFTAVIAGVFLFALILGVDNQQAHAETSKDNIQLASLGVKSGLEEVVTEKKEEPVPPKPQPIEYVIKSGDTLAKVAQENGESWQRLFNKNQQIADPNVVQVGDKVVIPAKDEILAERPLPAAQPVQTAAPSARTASKPVTASAPVAARGSSGGNTYSPGYCTWYAKQRRPDLPNNLGNAITWVAKARAQGIPIGSTPRAGAIGQQGNHVVYVEAVNANGTVLISEMNYKGYNVVSSRTAPASAFQYIY